MNIVTQSFNGFTGVRVVDALTRDAVIDAAIDCIVRTAHIRRDTNRRIRTISDYRTLEWIEQAEHTTLKLITGYQTSAGDKSLVTYYTTRTASEWRASVMREVA
jgi:hypothetical protein